MANDKAEPAKANDVPTPPNDKQVAHSPNFLEIVGGGFEAGLKAAKYTVQDKVAGLEQLGEQTVNATTGQMIYSKESIDALGPKEHEHAAAYTTNWYFEQAGQALPLVAAVTVGHKFFGALGAKEAVAVEKTTGGVIGRGSEETFKRAASLSLRQTPLGLSAVSAGGIGFASEFANPTNTTKNDSLLSSLGTRTVDGSIGALSMATMSLGTIGTQAAFKAVGKAIFKETAATAVDGIAVSSEAAVAKTSQNVFAKAAENTFSRIKSASGNAIIAGIGGMPGGVVGYIAGAEAHGQNLDFSQLAQNAVGSGVVGGMFGLGAGLRGNSEAAVKANTTSSDAPVTSTHFSARFEGARQAMHELVFGRERHAGQLGTAMASDAKGRGMSDFDKLAKSWDGYLEFAGNKGRVDAADVEDVLKRVESGNLKAETLQLYADGSNSAEQKAMVAASLRPETRAAFLKMMEVARDGSSAAQDGFAKDVSSDPKTVADLQMMAKRLDDPKLIKLVDAAANPTEPAAAKIADMPEIKVAASVGSTPLDFDEATKPGMKVKVDVAPELKEPVQKGFTQLLDAAKTSGTPEHMAAFFRAVDANPQILDGVKQLAAKTNLQSITGLAEMAEKPALRRAVSQLVEAAKDGGSDSQKQAFIDTVSRDRSTLPDLKKIAERYNDSRLKELVHAADTADVELVVGTQKEANDLKLAAKVIEKLVASGGTDTTDLNKVVRDDDALANLQPHLRHIAERLGGEEVAKKVDEAFAGRFQKVEVHTPGDESLPRPEEVQTVSVRSNLVKDFNNMTEIVQMLDEGLTNPQKEGVVNPDWIYSLLKEKAQTETGKALERSVKEYAQKTFDPRFQAFVNDAYLPPEGIVHGPESTFKAASQVEAQAFGPFATVMKGWPKVAAGEVPNRDDVLNYRSQVFSYLGAHPELHEMVLRYGQQTNSSFEASAIDTYYGTKNLERFPGVLIPKEAAPPESSVLRGYREDPVANTLVNGSLDASWAYLKEVSDVLAQPAAVKSEYSTRMFNNQPRVSQDNPAPGAGTWSVVEHDGTSIATVTGHPENLQKVQDFADGTRIEVYGRNGETEPYTQVYWPDNSNVKVVNPEAGGAARFKIEFPLQGNYISTDFPPDSKVAREISWDGNLTQINRDGSVGMQKNEDFKPFDPAAYDKARKTEAQLRDKLAETARHYEGMTTETNPEKRIEHAKALDPQYLSAEQFKGYLHFAFEEIPGTNKAYYTKLGNNASALESMRSKMEGTEPDIWAARLKDYLSVPEAGASKTSGGLAYPDWLAKQNIESLPNWLKNDIQQRFKTNDASASERVPAAVAEYLRTSGEFKDIRKGKAGKPDQSFQFRPLDNDSFTTRMEQLSDLNLAQPEVTARLMELGAQDGRALQDVMTALTNARNNNMEFRELMALTLPNATDIYSVKVMVEAMDKMKSPMTRDEDKQPNLELAQHAAAALAGTENEARAQSLINKINRNQTTRPPFVRGAKPASGPANFNAPDKNMLPNYSLHAPVEATPARPLRWGAALAKDAEATPDSESDDTTGDATDSSSATSRSAADSLRGKEVSPYHAMLNAPRVYVEPRELPPADEALPESHNEVLPGPTSTEAPADKTEQPHVAAAEAVEPQLPPEAEALSTKIGEKLTESGNLGANAVYETASGREFLIEPSGTTYERGLDKIGGQLWKNVDGQTEIWTDARHKLWDYNSESNFAVARDVPDGVSRQVLTFADDGSDPENRHPDSPHLAPRENVLSTFRDDGSVQFDYADGSRHTIGPRNTVGRPRFETFQFSAGDNPEGLKLRVTEGHGVDGVLPNGVKFSAADSTGKATLFSYPDGVAPFDAGSTVSFKDNIVTVTEGSGKQTVYHGDGGVEIHLPQAGSSAHDEADLHSPSIDALVDSLTAAPQTGEVQSSPSSSDSLRAEQIKSFNGTLEAKERFERALTRVDEVSTRKAESAERAERIKNDPSASRIADGTLVKSTNFADGPIEQVDESSTGKKVIHKRTEYPVAVETVTEDADGTRTTYEKRYKGGDSSLSFLESTRIEHADGRLELRYLDNKNDEYEVNSGRIEHPDGSTERWTDDTVDFRTLHYSESAQGIKKGPPPGAAFRHDDEFDDGEEE
jgi:hypothetical protein